MDDYIVRADAAEGRIRAFACTTANLTEHAREIHNTSPIVTAALGRLLSAGAMMGSMMKNEQDLLTLRIEGDGPLQGMIVTADHAGHVKGYPFVPDVILPPNEKGKLDVGGAVGSGMLSVISDIGMKEPYVGQVKLVSGEIAEDIAYYYASSEQVPSSVGLGVLMNHNNTVNSAGGFIVQLMPDCPEETVGRLESVLKEVHSVTDMLKTGMTPEDILKHLLADFDLRITEKTVCAYTCNCSRDRVEKALVAVGKKDLDEMIQDGKPVEVNCQFCGKSYSFSAEDLRLLRERAVR